MTGCDTGWKAGSGNGSGWRRDFCFVECGKREVEGELTVYDQAMSYAHHLMLHLSCGMSGVGVAGLCVQLADGAGEKDGEGGG